MPILARPWAYQPQQRPRLRSIDGLVYAWSAGSTNAHDLVSDATIAPSGTAAISTHLAGRGWSFTATTTSTASIGTNNSALLAQPFALVVVYAVTGTPASSARVCGTLNGATSGYEIAPSNTNYRGIISSSSTANIFTGDSITLNRIVVDVLSLNGTTGRYYQDGVQKALNFSTTYTAGTDGSFRLRMGSDNGGGTAAPCTVVGGALLRRPIFPQEAAQIDSPAGFWNWLFEPRRIWVPQTAASGLPTLSLSTYKPGALTSTGWTPRITAT